MVKITKRWQTLIRFRFTHVKDQLWIVRNGKINDETDKMRNYRRLPHWYARQSQNVAEFVQLSAARSVRKSCKSHDRLRMQKPEQSRIKINALHTLRPYFFFIRNDYKFYSIHTRSNCYEEIMALRFYITAIVHIWLMDMKIWTQSASATTTTAAASPNRRSTKCDQNRLTYFFFCPHELHCTSE